MKRAIIGIIAIVIILVGFIAAIPFVVSSDTVRNGITQRIEELTGRKVTFQGKPSLSINPFLGFEISDLELVDPSRSEADAPLIKVEKVKAQLNLIPALTGKVEITEYQFLRPQIVLKTHADGKESWNFSQGGLRKAIQTAITNRADQTNEPLAQSIIGDLIIIDGILSYDDEIDGTTETITSINGKVSWPNITSEMDISGNGIWRGEGITVNSNIENPIEILSGGESPVSVDLNSQPLAFVFNGQANMLANLFVKGSLKAETPSISRLATVLEFDIGDFNSFEQWGAVGELEATANNTNLSEATFTIGDSTATGVIRVSKNEVGQSKLDGTLAFETIDLSSNLGAPEEVNTTFQPELVKNLNVDLRISSQSINLGAINLDKVAAAIIIDNEGWTFDIGDASAFGGKVVAKLGERIMKQKRQAFLDISANDMDAESITSLIGKKLIGISGKTSFIANVRTNELKDGFLNAGLNGNFTGNFDNGEIMGINLTNLFAAENQANTSDIEHFNEAAVTPFQEMKIKFFLNNGIASLSQTNVQTDALKIQVIGDINLYQGIMDIQLQEVTEEGPTPLRYLLKGSTNKPTVTLKEDSLPVNQN